jgi:hypothetical protein
VKAKADDIGVTGCIQRFHADLKVCFEGSEEQCDTFLKWLLELKSHYEMIEYFDPIIDSSQHRRRYYDSFQKIIGHSRLMERCGTVIKGPYSDGDMDKS